MSQTPVPPPLSRRGFLLGTAAASALAAPAVAAALPDTAATGPHPDQALFDAEAEYRRAVAVHEQAKDAARAARQAVAEACGPYPAELILDPWEEATFVSIGRRPGVGHVHTHLVLRDAPDGSWTPSVFAWMADGLRRAIEIAPTILGPAGRTPHHIRRWRSLLPLADTFDAHCAGLDARFRCRELGEVAKAADDARRLAETRLARLPATTVEGLAIKVRFVDSLAWMTAGAPWIALLQSAAAVTGISLRQPKFDCARWVREMREVGGDVAWNEAREAVSISWPTRGLSPEQEATIARLRQEHERWRSEIRFSLSQGAAA